MTATIATKQLTKRYGHTVALDSLDLEIEPGEVFGYLGPNGAGKSTTIALLLGLIRPTSGSARIFDLDVRRDAPAIHRRLAYVPSEANLWPSLTGAETLRFMGNIHGSVDDAYRDELIERFELIADKKIRAYSHGNRQKVLLIAAFASRADVLLLDEPTSGLDPLMEQVFRACVREARDRGQTVLLSSHILSEVEALCDRVAMLRAGRIIETGHLDALRGLAALRVRAVLDSAPPDLSTIEGVSNIVVDGHTIECDVAGSMEPLLRVLADAGVNHMTTREPSLEELFVSHYGDGDAGAEPRAVNSDAAIARRAFGQVWIGASAWALVFGGTVAASALSYVSSFPTPTSRHQLAITTSGDKGLAVLLGPVAAIDTVGGYTVYKCFVFLTTIGAIWAILATTRLLRREEDAGRWQLMLAGGTRAPRATATTLAALGAAVTIIFGGTTLITLLAGRDAKVGFGAGGTVLYGLSLTIAPMVFVGVGALASQLSRTRRMASGLGMSVFGVAFVIRMIADSGPTTRWLLWATPFGWTERMRPLTHTDPWPLVPAVATALGLCVAAVAIAARRDTGEGVLASSDVSRLRPFGLRSPFGLAMRLELPSVAAWCVGAAASAFAFGTIVKVTTGSIPKSLHNTLDKFGVKGSFANQYFGVAFLLVATVVALLPAGQIGAASDEETSGRLPHVLCQPARRSTLFAGRIGLAGVSIAAAGLLAGFAAWLGARSQGVDVHFVKMVGAGLNVVPTALVGLGIGALMLAIAPRRASSAVYGVVIWSLLIDLLGSMVDKLSGLDRLSLFHYMALAPAQDPEPRTLAITVAIAITLCLVATVLFERRDLQSA